MAKAKPSSSKQPPSKPTSKNGSHALPSKLARYLDPEAPWDRDQLLDAVHWIRQAVGLSCGLLWGSFPFVGAVWIALFLAISTGIVYWYCRNRSRRSPRTGLNVRDELTSTSPEGRTPSLFQIMVPCSTPKIS